MRQAPTKLTLAALAAALSLALVPRAFAADWFLKLGDIKGESQDDKHKNEIEVLSWSFGASQAAAASTSPRSASKPCISDIALTKLTDRSTPMLFASTATGANIPTAKLSGRKAGSGQQDYYVITLKDVVITSFQSSGQGGALPAESLSLNFSSVQVEYTMQKDDGSLGETFRATIAGGC